MPHPPTEPESPQNPLYERYASREMARLWTAGHRFRQWRQLWIALAEVESEMGLPISGEQIAALRRAAPKIDLERVAELERRTRHGWRANHGNRKAAPDGRRESA
ncbi:MAG TPA: hypothetical protein VHR45_21015 [Thermoanaerobaculia bacterium]|nr:hypothetical protein [Thermoanaerobaculia bacterium]